MDVASTTQMLESVDVARPVASKADANELIPEAENESDITIAPFN
jgi:hypothetical protein